MRTWVATGSDVRVVGGHCVAVVEAAAGGTVEVRWEEPNELFPRFAAAPAWITRLQRLIDQLDIVAHQPTRSRPVSPT